MHWTLTHICHTWPTEGRDLIRLRAGVWLDFNNENGTCILTHHSLVERSKVDHTVALLKLPWLYFLALPVGTELDLDTAGAKEGGRPASWMLLGTNLVSVNSPRLGKLIHVKLELAIASHCIIALVAVVVATKTTQPSTQVGSSYNLHKTVTIPCYLQACRWGWETKSNVRVKLISQTHRWMKVWIKNQVSLHVWAHDEWRWWWPAMVVSLSR